MVLKGLGRHAATIAAASVIAGLLVAVPSQSALADPAGSSFVYTTGVGSETSSLALGVDDTVYASGYQGAYTWGNTTVQAVGAADDTLSPSVASLSLGDLPAGSNGANAVAAGPLTGPYANSLLVSSDNYNSGSCDPSAQSRIQAYDPSTWTVIQTWELPLGHCPSSMAVGPDGRVWFQELYENRVGRLSLDDSTTAFLEFPGSGSPNSFSRVGVGLDGNMYFAAQGAYSLLSVGTGQGGTTLDDTKLIPLPGVSPVTYDLVVANTGDIWIPVNVSAASTFNVVVYRPTDDTFVARSASLNTGAVKSIAQTSDGTIWAQSTDYSDSKYSAFSPFFTASSDPSTVNIAAHTDFTVAGAPTGSGYIVAGPVGQATLYRSTGTNSIMRIGVATAPQAVSLSPDYGLSGGNSQTVITGTALNTVTSVTFGGTPATIDDSTPTSLTVTVPPGTGTVDVVVTGSLGSSTLANSFTYTEQIVLNEDGGLSIDGSDGLRLVANYAGRPSLPLTGGTNGGEQILWSGASMYYQVGRAGALVTPSVWIGDDSATGRLFSNGVGYAGTSPRSALWDTTRLTAWDGVGRDQSATFEYTALFSSSPGDAQDDTYTMTRTINYSDDTPNEYRETWNFSFEMSSPTDDTETVTFYSGGDTAPGSSDQGFGVAEYDAGTGVRSIISANPTASVGTQVGYRTLRSSEPTYKDFDGAVAAALSSGWITTVGLGGDIGFNAQQSQHDASMAIQWDIPPTGGTYAFDTVVSRYKSLTSSAFSPSSIGGDDTSLLSLTLSNPSFDPAPGLGFQLQLPAQLVLADGSASTTCSGGTVTGAAGGSSLTLSGSSLAARQVATPGTIPSCTVTAAVRPQAAGTISFSASDVTATAGGLSNFVSARSLTVTTAPTPPTPPTPPVTNPPGPPTDVVAVAGDASANIAWSAPSDSGSFPISDYEVKASPGGAGCLVKVPATTCTVDDLANGTTYTFSVRALNGAGWGASSQSSNAVTPNPAPVDRTIVITGTRTEFNGRSGVTASGVTTGLVGATVRARVHLSGEIVYVDGSQRRVRPDGTFAWKRIAGKKVYVYFQTEDRQVRSNRIVIPMR